MLKKLKFQCQSGSQFRAKFWFAVEKTWLWHHGICQARSISDKSLTPVAAWVERILQLMLHSTMRHVLLCGCERHINFDMAFSNEERQGFEIGL